MKDLTKYLLPLLVLIAIAIGVLKLNKKPRWITPTEINLTIKTKVLAKVQNIPIPTKDSKADALHLLPKLSRILVVKVPQGSHPIALEFNGTTLPLIQSTSTIYQSKPVNIKKDLVEAKLVFAPRTIYKLPAQAIHFDDKKTYVIAKEGNGTKKLFVTILKKSPTYYLVAGKLKGVKVRLP